jgi:hypothetical protein
MGQQVSLIYVKSTGKNGGANAQEVVIKKEGPCHPDAEMLGHLLCTAGVSLGGQGPYSS